MSNYVKMITRHVLVCCSLSFADARFTEGSASSAGCSSMYWRLATLRKAARAARDPTGPAPPRAGDWRPGGGTEGCSRVRRLARGPSACTGDLAGAEPEAWLRTRREDIGGDESSTARKKICFPHEERL